VSGPHDSSMKVNWPQHGRCVWPLVCLPGSYACTHVSLTSLVTHIHGSMAIPVIVRMCLPALVLTGASLEQTAAATPAWLKSQAGRERLSEARKALQQLVASGDLNSSQGRAVAAALGRTLTLWQGPPGTGKTATLLRFCQVSLQVGGLLV
jgi:cobalamin biosynthesis protein CobD/CbiB